MAAALLEAAETSLRSRSSPNPMVGCTIVSGGEIIGAGATQPVGGEHAEVVALRQAGDRARGADMYVTLEPCCHHGRTPPCTDAIIAAGVARVFAGILDPNPLVNGNGVATLLAAGIPTHVGLMGEQCQALARPFVSAMLRGRPWVISKAAVTLDGRIATASGDSKWITGEAARTDVHRMRATYDAVMVGVATAIADDPQLTVRLCAGQDPLRVVVDTGLRLPLASRLLGPGTLVCHGRDETAAEPYAAKGADMLAFPRHEGPDGTPRLGLKQVMAALSERDVSSVLVEGGGRLHASLIRERLVDEVVVYVAPKLIGRGRPVLDLPSVDTIADGYQLEEVEVTQLGDDVRIRGLIRYPSASLESD